MPDDLISSRDSAKIMGSAGLSIKAWFEWRHASIVFCSEHEIRARTPALGSCPSPEKGREREKPTSGCVFLVSAPLSASVVQWPTCPLMLPLRRAENHLAAVAVVWSRGCATALELGQLSLLWGLENQQTLLGRETAFCRVSWSQYPAGTALSWG